MKSHTGHTPWGGQVQPTRSINLSSSESEISDYINSEPKWQVPGWDRHVDGVLESRGEPGFRETLLLIQTLCCLEVPHLISQTFIRIVLIVHDANIVFK